MRDRDVERGLDLAQVRVERPAQVGERAVVERRERQRLGRSSAWSAPDRARARRAPASGARRCGGVRPPGGRAAPSALRRACAALSARCALASVEKLRAFCAAASSARSARASARSSARASAGIDRVGPQQRVGDARRVLALQVAPEQRDVAAGLAARSRSRSCSVVVELRQLQRRASDRRPSPRCSSSRCATDGAHQRVEHVALHGRAPAGRARSRAAASDGRAPARRRCRTSTPSSGAGTPA